MKGMEDLLRHGMKRLTHQRRAQKRRAASGAACRFGPNVRGPGPMDRVRFLVDCQLNVDYQDLEGQKLLPYYEEN